MSGDLHCHTRLSDGSLGIEDLIIFAKKKGLETIAITDHDCLAGTVRGKIIGTRHGVQVIPGVELSATDEKNNKNVLVCPKCGKDFRKVNFDGYKVCDDCRLAFWHNENI